MRLQPDLVLLPLDDELVVFSVAAQCLVGLNASAALVLRELQEGKPASEIAQALASEGIAAPEEAARWVSAAFDVLGSHGLLADGRAPAALSTATQDKSLERLARRTAEMPPYAPFEAAAERRYRLLDTCALIRFAMLEQVPRVDSVIGHLATDDKSEPTVVMDIQGVRLDARGPVRSYIYRDGEPVEFTTGLHRLAPAVKAVLWQSAINAHDFLFYIHAGVVGTGETCVLLPAAPGSGKSSLTAALTHKGFHYFSDEVALIDSGTFQVNPMPLAFCLKSTGWDLMARYYPEILTLPIHQRNDGKVVRYLAPPAAALQQTSAPVSHIIFPRYDKDGTTELKPIARSEALRRLMDECLALSQRLDRENVGELVRWIERVDCYALPFSSLDEAVELVAQTMRPQLSKS
jgi:hypothetical protein